MRLHDLLRGLGLISLSSLVLVGCAATAQIRAPGVVAPDFTVVSLDNRAVRLADFKGAKKPVLVFYFGYD